MTVTIRKFEKADIPLKIKWINDSENNKFLHYELPLREDKTLEWFKTLDNRKDRVDYTILNEEVPVGLIGLLNINSFKKNAEYYICLGGKEFKGKGIAKKATECIFHDAYHKFFLEEIYLYTEVENIVAQKLFEKIGFSREALMKNHLLYNEKSIDRYYYTINLKKYYKDRGLA